MVTKKELKCNKCLFYKENQCTHTSNIGILIKNRKEQVFYKNTAKDLEKSCKNYKENV